MSVSAREPSCVIRPEEFETLTAIFRDIMAEPWFSHDLDVQKQCARHIITAYRGGMTNPFELKAHCMEVARERFSQTVN